MANLSSNIQEGIIRTDLPHNRDQVQDNLYSNVPRRYRPQLKRSGDKH
jgi:hypothetical protein